MSGEQPCLFYHGKTQQEDSRLWTWKWALTWHQIFWCLDIGLLELWEYKFLLFKSPNLWYRQFPTYDGSNNNFLTLWWCESNMHLVETVLWNLIFPWASDKQYNTLLWCWAVSHSTQVSHTVTRVNNPYVDNYSVPIQPFCFSLLQYSINYMRYSIPYYFIK